MQNVAAVFYPFSRVYVVCVIEHTIHGRRLFFLVVFKVDLRKTSVGLNAEYIHESNVFVTTAVIFCLTVMWPLSDFFLNLRYENLVSTLNRKWRLYSMFFFWIFITEFFRILLCSSNWQYQTPCWCDNFPCAVSAIQHLSFLFLLSLSFYHVLAHAINFKNIYSNWRPSLSMMMKCTEHTCCWHTLSVHIETVYKIHY